MQLASGLCHSLIPGIFIKFITNVGIKNTTSAAIALFIALEIAFGKASLSLEITTDEKSNATIIINTIGTKILTIFKMIFNTSTKSLSSNPLQSNVVS